MALYAPYGGVRYSTGTMPTSYGFTNQRLDGSGLNYFHARYYDPTLGQFTSADPLLLLANDKGNVVGLSSSFEPQPPPEAPSRQGSIMPLKIADNTGFARQAAPFAKLLPASINAIVVLPMAIAPHEAIASATEETLIMNRWHPQTAITNGLGKVRSWSRYRYADGNPLTLTDPNGLWTISFCGTYFFGLGIGSTGSACISVGHSDAGKTSVSVNVTTGGIGVAGEGATAGGAIFVTNAQSVKDLNGPFVIGGGTGGILGNFSAEGITGNTDTGKIFGGGVGISAGESLAIYGGATYTWTPWSHEF